MRMGAGCRLPRWSLGHAGGETIARTIRHASRAGVPVIGVPHSGGARLQEGVAALSAYGAIFREQALARVPQITLVPGPCAGGAAYSSALGDFVMMIHPHGRLLLTGPRVVEQVTREQTSACLLYTSPSPRDRQKSRMPSS